MASQRLYPTRRPEYRVEVSNTRGNTWHRRAALYDLAEAMRYAHRAADEMGWMRQRLFSNVRVVDGNDIVIAAWRDGRTVPMERIYPDQHAGGAA